MVHTTAAASTVVGAFMCGLAGGSALGGRIAPRLTPRQSLYAYALLEFFVVLLAVLLPLELRALTPLLTWSYENGRAGILFPIVRLLSCLVVLLGPALALGATFPVAVRWFVNSSDHPGRAGGALYAANSTGATIGALGAGFALLPAIGIAGTTFVGVTASGLAIASVLAMARSHGGEVHPRARVVARHERAGPSRRESSQPPDRRWLAAFVLGFTGFGTFIYEIAWTRVFSLIIGPSTYAFAATLTALIAGIALGSIVGSTVAGRTRRPALGLVLALAGAAIAASWATGFAGGPLPRLVARALAASPQVFSQTLMRHSMLVAALILPTAAGLGVAFPLALELAGNRDRPAARSLGAVYAVNTLAAVAGSLVSGFVAIPFLGLQHTLDLATAVLLVAAFTVIFFGKLSRGAQIGGLLPALVALGCLIWSPPWDRELLASGAYMYAPLVAKDLDTEAALKAGTLLYYREGAVATVSVKRLTGALALSIDGKVDASTSGDMITQKALAHLPLLLHPDPRDVCIIGLGSGVTLASALLHTVRSVDIVEISPEVVEASRYFAAENRNALTDPRTHLILGDGRSHLWLSSRKYDVIISEPSNPWMAGVAALFTREFFTAMRNRLAPGGIICQWAHTYTISARDLRSIVATFASVFPNGSMWLVGDGDLLLVASADSLDSRLANLARGWEKPAIAADLRDVSALEPFAFWSMYVGGPAQLGRYSVGATIQTDDRMALEFSGPRALYSGSPDENAATLRQLLDARERPPAITRALASAGAAEWRDLGAMMLKADSYVGAYRSYITALDFDPADTAALGGFVRAAVATHRQAEAIERLKASIAKRPQLPAIRIALSKLLAASGAIDQAIATAREACNIQPVDPAALEQLASLVADVGDAARLGPIVEELRQRFPERPGSHYYAAALSFLRGQYSAALDLARQTVALDPRYPAAQNLLGAIYASLGQTQPAREAFQAALRLDARDSATYANLGLLELASHNRTAAAGFFGEALSLDPASEAARQGLVQARAGATE
jgi:spermidine synthase